MIITFLEVLNGQCRFPISGTGATMLVCGEPTLPAHFCCAACKALAYYPKREPTTRRKAVE
jgi:hypothetical protein